jgi:RloB-like protein
VARRHISRIRRKSAFRRRAGQREPRSITLIVCEGETEEGYFDAARAHFNLTTAEVMIADNTKGPAPISVVDCAEERAREQGGYDAIFCVFDRDGHESFDRARAKIKGLAGRSRNRLNMHEVISVPCFELWVLLHFERTDRPFQKCKDVIERIRREHLADYEKADNEVTKKLILRVETAMANAQWLAGRTEIESENPSTSVNALVQHVKGVGSRSWRGE